MNQDAKIRAIRDAMIRALYSIAALFAMTGICVFLNIGDLGNFLGFDEDTRKIFGGAVIIMAFVDILVAIPLVKRKKKKKQGKAHD